MACSLIKNLRKMSQISNRAKYTPGIKLAAGVCVSSDCSPHNTVEGLKYCIRNTVAPAPDQQYSAYPHSDPPIVYIIGILSHTNFESSRFSEQARSLVNGSNTTYTITTTHYISTNMPKWRHHTMVPIVRSINFICKTRLHVLGSDYLLSDQTFLHWNHQSKCPYTRQPKRSELFLSPHAPNTSNSAGLFPTNYG